MLVGKQAKRSVGALEQKALPSIYRRMGVRPQICFLHELPSCFFVPAFVAVVMNIDVEPREAVSREGGGEEVDTHPVALP